MRRNGFVTMVVGPAVGMMLVLGACGGSSKASPTTTPIGQGVNQNNPATYTKAGANPSVSAKMVCETEARNDIASALGTKETKVTTPTWVDHVYSCTYVYPNGSYTLSVKELASEAQTTDYFNAMAKKYGKKQNLVGLGQGAFVTTHNDVVVRKDFKVLLVDVSKVPADFIPAMRPSDVAINVAATIMGCWTGS